MKAESTSRPPWSDDFIFADGGDDVVRGEGGADPIYGQGGDDDLIGGKGDDGLAGGKDNDWLKGDDGEDTYAFRLGDGFDYIYFMKAHDTIQFVWGDEDAGRVPMAFGYARRGADGCSRTGKPLIESDVSVLGRVGPRIA